MNIVIILFMMSLVAPLSAQTAGVVVGNSGSKSSFWFRQWQEFRRNVDEKSNGSLLLDYLIFGELGSSDTMVNAVASGRADIGGFNCKSLTSLVPELAIPQMPFLFSREEEADFVMDRSLSPLFERILAEHNLVLLQWLDLGWTDLYSKAPVQFPSQLAGQQVRTVPNISGPLFLKAMNAEPLIISGNEELLPSQLSKIFGGIANSTFYTPKIQALFPFYTETRQSLDCGMFVANKTWYDNLTPESRKIIRSSFMNPAQARRDNLDTRRKTIDQIAQSGNLIKLDVEQQNAWEAVGLPLYQTILQTAGGQSIQVYDAIREGKKAFLQQNALLSAHQK